MNTRIKKKKAFSVVNEATEFSLRVKHPNTFIKEGYKLMKLFKSEPSLFMKRGQHVEPFSKLTPEEAMLMWQTPEYKEDRKRKQAILDKYGKDVVWLSDEAFAKVMAVRGLNDLLKEKKEGTISVTKLPIVFSKTPKQFGGVFCETAKSIEECKVSEET